MNYQGNGGVKVSSKNASIVVVLTNPARYQTFKFYLGEWCGIPGSPLLHRIVRVTCDGSQVTYTVEAPNRDRYEVLERFCLTESELRDAQIQQGEWAYADAVAKINRLVLGG